MVMAEASHCNGIGHVMASDWLPTGNNSLLHPDFTRQWSGLAKFPV
jgi:hypothetical protein